MRIPWFDGLVTSIMLIFADEKKFSNASVGFWLRRLLQGGQQMGF